MLLVFKSSYWKFSSLEHTLHLTRLSSPLRGRTRFRPASLMAAKYSEKMIKTHLPFQNSLGQTQLIVVAAILAG